MNNLEKELAEKMAAISHGLPSETVYEACRWVLMNVIVQSAPSADKACSAIRIMAKDMQQDIRENWAALRRCVLKHNGPMRSQSGRRTE
jgi:hypothetical protein